MNEPDSAIRERTREHLAALEVLRIARNAFFSLALAALAAHLLAWLLIETAAVAPADRGASPWQPSPAVRTDDSAAEAAPATGSERWAGRVEFALRVAGFVGRASALVLAGLYIVSLLVSLTGGLGGAGGLARACVWSLAALALVTPWVGSGVDQAAGSHSALYGYDEIADSPFSMLVSVVRFVLCPLLVAGFLTLSHLEFRRAYRKISMVSSTKLPIHEV